MLELKKKNTMRAEAACFGWDIPFLVDGAAIASAPIASSRGVAIRFWIGLSVPGRPAADPHHLRLSI